MKEKSFRCSDVLSFGWDTMKENFWFFVGVLIVPCLISFAVIAFLETLVFLGITSLFSYIALYLALAVIEIIIGIGLIKITNSFCDNIKPKFRLLFNGLDCFWRFLGAGVLYNLIILAVVAVCVSPLLLFKSLTGAAPSVYLRWFILIMAFIVSTIASLKFILCNYFVVDKGVGPIKALKASSLTTEGVKWNLFVFGILCGLINLLCMLLLAYGAFISNIGVMIMGLLFYIVSLFATVPMTMVSMSLIYKQLVAHTPELADLGISTPATKAAQLYTGIQTGLSIRISRGDQDDQPSSGAASTNPPDSAGATSNVQPDEKSNVKPDENNAVNLSIRLSEEHPTDDIQLSDAQPGSTPPVDTQPTDTQPTDTLSSGIQSVGIQPASIQPKENIQPQEKKNTLLWIVIIILGIGALIAVCAVALGYFSKNETTATAPFIPPKIVINGILYSENPSVIIGTKIVKEGDIVDGAKVIKINKDTVEFEKDGQTWTQKLE